MHFFKNLLLYSKALVRQTTYVGMVCQNCKIHDYQDRVVVQERGYLSHIVKMHYFFKNILLFSQA